MANNTAKANEARRGSEAAVIRMILDGGFNRIGVANSSQLSDFPDQPNRKRYEHRSALRVTVGIKIVFFYRLNGGGRGGDAVEVRRFNTGDTPLIQAFVDGVNAAYVGNK